MGDEDDGGAGLLELTHDLHQLVGLLRGEHRRRLVEDEHARVTGERLDDLDPLLHTDGEILDERIRVDVEAETVGDLAHLRAGAVEVEAASELRLLVPEHHVLCDREHRDEHEVLVHHADSGGHRIAWAGEALHDIVEQDLALVGLIEAVEHVHQGGLACPVLAEQGVDLAGLDGEVNMVIGYERPEFLRDAAKFELHGS